MYYKSLFTDLNQAQKNFTYSSELKSISWKGAGETGGVGLGEREGLGRGRKRAGKIEGLGCPWAIFE